MLDNPEEFEGIPEENQDSGGRVPEEGAPERNLEEREVRVVGVYEHNEQPGAGMPFVLLRDNQSRCVLIWVGRFEAYAISMALEGATAPRPMTHDLLKNLAEKLNAQIDRIVIDDLWDETFYAKIWINAGGKSLTVDSRPSDAVALALRAKCPIFMTEAVLEEASKPCDEIEGT